MRRNRASKRALVPAIRTSHASARLNPAPTAGPFTAAIVGIGHSRIAQEPGVDVAHVVGILAFGAEPS